MENVILIFSFGVSVGCVYLGSKGEGYFSFIIFVLCSVSLIFSFAVCVGCVYLGSKGEGY